MNKIEFIKSLTQVEKIFQANYISDDLQERIDLQKKKVEEFRTKILFVGGFSAGKTTLINTLLGDEEILRENITAETAIATEVMYGTKEQVVCVQEDGTQNTVSLDAIESVSPTSYLKYIYYLNRESLKLLGNITIVDMPGFDSGIEAHNKALLQYIDEAAGYVFVIDAAKGTMGQSAIEFLQEIKQYTPYIKFVLTKCDKIPSSDMLQVQEQVKREIASSMGTTEISIIDISRDDEKGREKLMSLLLAYPKDELLLTKLGPEAVALMHEGRQALLTKLEALSFDPHDIDVEIHKRQRAITKFNQQLEAKKASLHVKIQSEKIPNVMNDIQHGLMLHSSELALKVENEQSFTEAVNNILRPIFVQSLQRNIESSFDEYIDVLQSSVSEQHVVDVEGMSDTMRDTLGAVRNIMSQGLKMAKKGSRLYMIFSTGLAITTNVVAPWLEFILIFLPDILIGLSKVFGKSKKEALKEILELEVIPQLCEKLRPKVTGAFAEIETNMIQEIEERFTQLMNTESKALDTLKKERKTKNNDIHEAKILLQSDIDTLQKIYKAIQSC